MRKSPTSPAHSEDFALQLEALADAQLQPQNRVEVLTSGDCFYEAELAAIRVVHEALTERARAGVNVRLTACEQSVEVTYGHWRNRTFVRVYEWTGGLLEHQE